ncbi:MAG: hypothetical protein ACTSU2_01315 [Promethearchaeota archaeon]
MNLMEKNFNKKIRQDLIEDIYEIFILKNGLPIYNFSLDNRNNQNKLEQQKLTMISGFFSAINTFAENIENFGKIKELKMSRNIKFSFYKPENTILIIISSSYQVLHEYIEEILKGISDRFIQKYSEVLKRKWDGKVDVFGQFDNDIREFLNEYNEELKIQIRINGNSKKTPPQISEISASTISQRHSKITQKNQITKYLTQKIREKNKSDLTLHKEQLSKYQKSLGPTSVNKVFDNYIKLYRNLIPLRTINEEDNEEIMDCFMGEDSKKVFRAINGRNSINTISQITQISSEKVFNLCKTFLKMGLINLTKN